MAVIPGHFVVAVRICRGYDARLSAASARVAASPYALLIDFRRQSMPQMPLPPGPRALAIAILTLHQLRLLVINTQLFLYWWLVAGCSLLLGRPHQALLDWAIS